MGKSLFQLARDVGWLNWVYKDAETVKMSMLSSISRFRNILRLVRSMIGIIF
jgi:hypothetical protein